MEYGIFEVVVLRKKKGGGGKERNYKIYNRDVVGKVYLLVESLY